MKIVHRWRWLLVLGFPVVLLGALVWRGILSLNYEGRAVLSFSGDAKQKETDMALFRSHNVPSVAYAVVPGQPSEFSLSTQGSHPEEIVERLLSTGQMLVQTSLTKEKTALAKEAEDLRVRKADLDMRFKRLNEDRAALLAGTKRRTPRAELVAKIEELKGRRRLLIERFPTHSDIPVLAKQIQELVNQMGRPAAPLTGKVSDLDRQVNEVNVRLDYFSRQFQQASTRAQSLKPKWKIVRPIEKPSRPNRVVGWPIGAGVFLASMVLGFLVSNLGGPSRSSANKDGLWRPEAAKTPDIPVALEVVLPEPAGSVSPASPTDALIDPLTEKASQLYAKWVELAKILYAPAPEPPQGILDQVAPLLQESNDFLSEGHDVLTKYLARRMTSRDLAAHVARTVLMTLTGAQEAGVSPEHCLAMALAALFHDLAVVPRPSGLQEEVGSEVGRLSASVLRRIPGLQPALLSMVEDILIGMDEFKLETWQNAVNGNTLEPLSKVLREIDRFEKVMQKQKSRLDRRVANQ